MTSVISTFLLLVGGAFSIQAALPAVPADAMTALRTPTNIVLYSLEPWEEPTAKDETLHGVKILGQTKLDAKQAKTAIAAFEAAISEGSSDGPKYRCFDPRHALRVTANGQTYDFLLCYACRGMAVYQDRTVIVRVAVAGTPDALNALLTAAHIPLSKDK